MIGPNVIRSNPAVLFTAPLTPDYPQFRPAPVPLDGTTAAWADWIRPFASDHAARSVLADLLAGRQLMISQGQILNRGSVCSHWANPYLVGMSGPCEILICFRPDAQPRAYILNTPLELHYADQNIYPHPRGDLSIPYRGARVLGLCVLSSAEYVPIPWIDEQTQFLDQMTQFVASHLIWLRTRRRFRMTASGRRLIYQPAPGEHIADNPPTMGLEMTPSGPIKCIDYWSGFWPGKSAAATTPLTHIQQLSPSGPCWCGLKRVYGQCCRPKDIARLPAAQQQWYGVT